jgi:hypothetical protein
MDALTVLEAARAAGLRIEAEGDRLLVKGPRDAAHVVELLRQHKAEVLLALQGRCSPTCRRCAAGPVLLPDGCELHSVSAEDVARWWKAAEERDAEVSVCHCCAGPAPSGMLVCRKCAATPARSAR